MTTSSHLVGDEELVWFSRPPRHHDNVWSTVSSRSYHYDESNTSLNSRSLWVWRKTNAFPSMCIHSHLLPPLPQCIPGNLVAEVLFFLSNLLSRLSENLHKIYSSNFLKACKHSLAWWHIWHSTRWSYIRWVFLLVQACSPLKFYYGKIMMIFMAWQ